MPKNPFFSKIEGEILFFYAEKFDIAVRLCYHPIVIFL